MSSRPTTPRQGSNQRDFIPIESMYPSVLPQYLQHAGYQQDLNHVYGLVNELSEVLRQNREQTDRIVQGVARIRARVAEGGAPLTLHEVNAELNGVTDDATENITNSTSTNGPSAANNAPASTSTSNTSPDAAMVAAAQMNQLQDLITKAQRERDAYERLFNSEKEISGLYERTMDQMMDMVRAYCFNKANEGAERDRQWNARLQELRDQNLEMRLEHSRWQEGLGRAMNWSRLALRELAEHEEPFAIERAELKHENRFLRRLVGWEAEESDDEGDGEQREPAE